MTRPELLTFDIFGTVVDWRRGLGEAVARHGLVFSSGDFERVIDAQAADEQAGYRPYRAITARSLAAVLGIDPAAADAIGAACGRWPLFPEAAGALARLGAVAPCMALTNSDRDHGAQVEAALGFRLADWLCAEDTRVYKPDVRFWQAAAARRGLAPGPAWWHVSAYADYDLAAAASLGLTTVFVERPHRRPGPADLTVPDLGALADHLEGR